MLVSRGAHVRTLLMARSVPGLLCGGFLLRRGPRIHSARAAVVADVVDRHVVDGAVVDIGDVGRPNVVHRAVVPELVVAPVAALVSVAEITEPVDDSAVKANLGRPVTRVPRIGTITVAPVTGGPHEVGVRRQHPGAGYPVVAAVVLAPAPVSGNPQVAGCR